MHANITAGQIALRLALAMVASFFIGLNRDERGHPAGLRTTMLVCLAAALAMLQMNLLLAMVGRASSSFIQNDLMRLPLGILSGIGFIGAGVIVKRNNQFISGVTTAATLWYVTVLGLLFGGGQLRTGCVAAVIAIGILWGLTYVERLLPREHHGNLTLTLDTGAPSEEMFRERLFAAGYGFTCWNVTYDPAGTLSCLQCTLRWREQAFRSPHTPIAVAHLRTLPGVRSLKWDE